LKCRENLFQINLSTFFLEIERQRMATADEEDDCDDTSSDGRNDNPNDDRLYTTGNSDDNKKKSKKTNFEDQEFAKKFIFNMTREQARFYISVSGLVFVASLFVLIRTSS